MVVLETSTAGMGVPMLVMGALMDSLNPCALGSLVVLFGLLLPGLDDWRQSLVTGLSVVAGIFAVYLFAGLGMLSVVGSLDLVLSWAMIAALTVGGAVLLIAAFRGSRLRLPVPDSGAFLVAAAVGTGMLLGVSLMPCTGQVYLAIVGLIHASNSAGLPLLLLYNTVFLLPSIVVVLAASGIHATGMLERLLPRRSIYGLAGGSAYLTEVMYLSTLMLPSGQPPATTKVGVFTIFAVNVIAWTVLLYRWYRE